MRFFILFLGLVTLSSQMCWARWSEDISQPDFITSSSPSIRYLTSVSDGQAGVYVFWQSGENYDCYGQHLNDQGDRLWGEDGRLLVSLPGVSSPVDAVAGNNGNFFITWYKGYESSGEQMVQQFDINGNPQWPIGGVTLNLSNASQYRVLSTGGADTYVAWVERREADPDNPYRGGVYLQKIQSDGSLAWPAGGIKIHKDVMNGCNLNHFAVAPSGDLIVYFFTSGGPVPWGPRVQQVSLSGQRLWGDNGMSVPYLNLVGAHAPNTVFDNSGGYFMFASEMRSPTGPDNQYWMYAYRASKDGWPWGTAGIPCSGPLPRYLDGCCYSWTSAPGEACLDGTGGVLAAWSRAHASSGSNPASFDHGDISIQRLSATGEKLWGTPETRVWAQPDIQVVVGLLSDGSGGAIVVGANDHTIISPRTELRLQAQRYNSAGEPLWNTQGLVCNASKSYDLMSYLGRTGGRGTMSVPDGRGGVYIIWEGYSDIGDEVRVYGRHINPDGTFGPSALESVSHLNTTQKCGFHAGQSWAYGFHYRFSDGATWNSAPTWDTGTVSFPLSPGNLGANFVYDGSEERITSFSIWNPLDFGQ